MVLPESLEDLLLSVIENHIGEKVDIERSSSLSGGSINSAFRIKTMHGNYFAKYNSASQYPEMFKKEALGLEILHNAGEVYTPEVIGYGEAITWPFLFLNMLMPGWKSAHSGKISEQNWPVCTNIPTIISDLTMIITSAV